MPQCAVAGTTVAAVSAPAAAVAAAAFAATTVVAAAAPLSRLAGCAHVFHKRAQSISLRLGKYIAKVACKPCAHDIHLPLQCLLATPCATSNRLKPDHPASAALCQDKNNEHRADGSANDVGQGNWPRASTLQGALQAKPNKRQYFSSARRTMWHNREARFQAIFYRVERVERFSGPHSVRLWSPEVRARTIKAHRCRAQKRHPTAGVGAPMTKMP